MRLKHFFIFLMLCVVLAGHAFAGENIGKVIGMVFDAQTKEVIEGAKITVEKKGEFKEEKKPIETLAGGEFLASADLGASSSEFSFGALMLSSGFSLLLNPGSVTKKTRSMDVDHINMKIEKEGYKLFWGSVPINQVNAKQNHVILFPVFLVKNESSGASFTQTKFMENKTLSVTVSPEVILLQDKKPKLHVTVQIPELPFSIKPQHKIKCFMSNLSRAALTDGTGYDFLSIKEVKLKKGQKEVAFDFNMNKKFLAEGSAYIEAALNDEENEILTGREPVVFIRVPETRDSASKFREAVRSFENNEETLSLLKDAVQGSNIYLPAHKELAAYYLEVKLPQDAANVLEPLLSQYPDDVGVKILYAQAEVDLNNAQKSRETLDSIKTAKLTKEQKSTIAYLYGKTYFIENNDDEALKYFKKADYADKEKLQIATRKNPESEKAWIELGNYYAKLATDLGMAKEAYEKALDIKKDNAATLFSLGKIYFQLQDFSAAVDRLEQAVSVKKSNTEIQEWLGLAAFKMGDESKAKEALEAGKGKPKLFFTPYILGLLSYKSGDMDAANKQWGKALSLGRENVEGIRFKQVGSELGLGLYAKSKWHFFKGFAYDEAQDIVRVVESKSVLKNHADNFLALYHLGDGLVQMGLVDEGIAQLNQCVTVNPEAQDCLVALGKAYAAKGDAAQAKEILNKVVALNPYHPEAAILLASVYEKDKQFGEAKAALENYLAYYVDDESAKQALNNVNQEMEQEKLSQPVTPPVEPKKEIKKPAKKKEAVKKKEATKNKGKKKTK